MWQIYALASLLFQAGGEVVDKIVVVTDLAIDSLSATFYRNAIYFLFAVMVGLTGIIGPLVFVHEWPILLVGVFSVGSALFWTYLLKHVELTGASALGYSRPIIFLIIDVLVLEAAFSRLQIGGVLLLVCGGMLFVINPLTHRLKPEYNRYVWLIFFYETISYIAEYYVFKHYALTRNLNEISYIFSTYVFVVLGLFLLMLWKSNWRTAVATAVTNKYMSKMVLSKGFDFISTLLLYRALKLSTVSQVSAIGAYYPLILFVALYIAQAGFKYKAGESFDRDNLVLKTIGTAVLVLGIWLSS